MFFFSFWDEKKATHCTKTEKDLKKKTQKPKLRYLASVRSVHIVIPIWEATTSRCHSSIPWLVWLVALSHVHLTSFKSTKRFWQCKKENLHARRKICSIALYVCPWHRGFLGNFLQHFKTTFGNDWLPLFPQFDTYIFLSKREVTALPLTVHSWSGEDFGPTRTTTTTKKHLYSVTRTAYMHFYILYSCRPPLQRSHFKGNERYNMRDRSSCNDPAAF